MKYWIFLDDIRDPNEKAYIGIGDGEMVICRNFYEFRDTILERGCPRFIAFDHDLGRGPNGLDCARFLVDYLLDHPDDFNLDENIPYDVHSMNPVGARNIRGLLDNFFATR